MSESIRASVNLALGVTEVLDAADFPGASNAQERTVTHKNYDLSDTLVTDTAPDPDAVFSEQYTATATLDLTAAPKSGGSTQNLTGKKLIGFLLRAPKENTAAVTVDDGATNPYSLNGGDPITIQPGQTIGTAYESGDTTSHAAVSGTVKNIDITIAGSDKLNVTMLFGGT